jgi:hypothetical protein
MFCVIAGLEWVEIKSATKHMRTELMALIELLVEHSNHPTELGRLFRLLFTTSGILESLGGGFPLEETIWIDQSAKGKATGKWSIGRMPVKHLNFDITRKLAEH